MMTSDQYDRLARIGKKIIDHDRDTAALLAEPVVPLAFAWELRNRRGDRQYLRKVAHDTYGGPRDGDRNGGGRSA